MAEILELFSSLTREKRLEVYKKLEREYNYKDSDKIKESDT